MNDYLKQYIKEKYRQTKKFGIFGTGNLSCVAEELLLDVGIEDFVFFDNDAGKREAGSFHNRKVLDPAQISRDYFILVSTVHFRQIQNQLEELGLKELDNYIYALELEYYDALLHYKTAPRVPEVNDGVLSRIEKELGQYADMETIDWFDENELQALEREMGFQEIYEKQQNRRYRRKMMEYYVVDKLLRFADWGKGDIYIDIGAAGSPFAKYLREQRGVNAYGLDLDAGKYSYLDYYLQENAVHMHFDDSSVRAISMQSAFEMFMGDADIEFIAEASRVLEKGGKVIILPLYMHEKYLSTVSPNYYKKGYADKDSLECIRTDCRGGIPLGRFYNAKALDKRILGTAQKNGLRPQIYVLPDDMVERDEFVYLKFILCLKKI